MKRDHVDVGVRRSAPRRPPGPVPVTTLTTPSGMPGVGAGLGEHQRGQRGELGRLEHDRVAGRDRREDLPAGHLQRVVPRRDRADDADRLAADIDVWSPEYSPAALPSRLRAAPAKNATLSTVPGTSKPRGQPDRLAGLPRLGARRARRPGRRARRQPGERGATAPTGVARDQAGKAARAAATAASTSAVPASATGLDGLARRGVDDVEGGSPEPRSCGARRRTGARESDSSRPADPTRLTPNVTILTEQGRGQAIPSRCNVTSTKSLRSTRLQRRERHQRHRRSRRPSEPGSPHRDRTASRAGRWPAGRASSHTRSARAPTREHARGVSSNAW